MHTLYKQQQRTKFNAESAKYFTITIITWIPSRTRIRCGDGNHRLQSLSFWFSSTMWKVEGILIKAITLRDSVDCTPESFFITAELTWTTRIVSSSSSNSLGTLALSSTSKQSIVLCLSCVDSWNLYISLWRSQVSNDVKDFRSKPL